jgi:hypothetical protein
VSPSVIRVAGHNEIASPTYLMTSAPVPGAGSLIVVRVDCPQADGARPARHPGQAEPCLPGMVAGCQCAPLEL